MHSTSDYDQCSIQAFASLKLTPREADVLFWISRGKGNHDIGIILGAKTGTTANTPNTFSASSTWKTARLQR
jgi:DNA-binding CsgD family transcriptional regulator